MSTPEPMSDRCGALCRDGGHCGYRPIAGTKRCRLHSGMPSAKAKAKGAVVVEVTKWGLGDTTVDPGEVLLRLVTQSAARVELYSRLLEEAYEAAEQLRTAHEAEHLVLADPEERVGYRPNGDEYDRPEHPATQAARLALRRIFTTGGVAALIGNQFDATKDGELYATQEAIRGLARLEAEERDRCFNFASKAVAAGLAERQVRIAEQAGLAVADAVRRVLARLGLSAGQLAEAPRLLMEELAVVAGPKVIEGSRRE